MNDREIAYASHFCNSLTQVWNSQIEFLQSNPENESGLNLIVLGALGNFLAHGILNVPEDLYDQFFEGIKDTVRKIKEDRGL